jgi:hypothetical protein
MSFFIRNLLQKKRLPELFTGYSQASEAGLRLDNISKTRKEDQPRDT